MHEDLNTHDYLYFKDRDRYLSLAKLDQILIHARFNEEEIGVEQCPGYRSSEIFVMSGMVKKSQIGRYLNSSDYYNYPFQDLGQPYIWTRGLSGRGNFNLGKVQDGNGIEAYYFIRRYNPDRQTQPRFPIEQSFLFYHQLVEYVRKYDHLFVDVSNGVEVIREHLNPHKPDEHRVLVLRHYLKDYLAARKMGLALWVSISRRVYSEEPIEECSVDDGPIHCHVRVADWLGPNMYFSELVLKIVVEPYRSVPDNRFGRRAKDYSKSAGSWSLPFILNTDEKTGSIIESDEKTHFLTPVYFKKDLLTKYINDNRGEVNTYTAQLGGVGMLGDWTIAYGINHLGYIVAWLGDVQKMDYEEQLHWRHYNVPPQGAMPEEFWKTQMEAQWVDTESLETRLLGIRKKINEVFTRKFGKPLFKRIVDQEEFEKHLHTVIGKGMSALKPQIAAIGKLFGDSIDEKLLKTIVDDKELLKNEKDEPLRGFNLVDVFWRKEFPERSYASPSKHLKVVWKLRGLHAHVFSEDDYRKIITGMHSGIDPLNQSSLYSYLMTQIIRDLTAFYNALVERFDN